MIFLKKIRRNKNDEYEYLQGNYLYVDQVFPDSDLCEIDNRF